MEQATQEQITQLLQRLDDGDREAVSRLFPLVQDELYAIARAFMARERPGHTLQPTALVNEAYMRLAGKDPHGWKDRRHFYRAAAVVMRTILVNHARKRRCQKRGGGARRVPLDEMLAAYEERAIDLLALDEALKKLETVAPRQADLIELRFFAGLSTAEIAEVLGVSERTAQVDWNLTRAWLRQELNGVEPPNASSG